mmetsp:Transcript_17353/g.48092  ORF Transcript_17353/g.48092 Transcript_17353/m.48092 type:complete len:99 (+) Transcript_17353:864-1160(+)
MMCGAIIEFIDHQIPKKERLSRRKTFRILTCALMAHAHGSSPYQCVLHCIAVHCDTLHDYIICMLHALLLYDTFHKYEKNESQRGDVRPSQQSKPLCT